MSHVLAYYLQALLRMGVYRRISLRRRPLMLSVDSQASAVLLTTMLLFAVVWAWSSYNSAPPASQFGDAMLGAFFGMLWGLVAGTLLLFTWRDPLLRVLLPLGIATASVLGFAGHLCGRLLAPIVRFADLPTQLVCLGVADALVASVLLFRWASGRKPRHQWLQPVIVFGLFFCFGMKCSHGNGIGWMLMWAGANGVVGLIAMLPMLRYHYRARVYCDATGNINAPSSTLHGSASRP